VLELGPGLRELVSRVNQIGMRVRRIEAVRGRVVVELDDLLLVFGSGPGLSS
jgi:hypothetical protein